MLPKQFTQDPASAARFKREMKAVGKLVHPHIVRAMDAGEIGGTHYLAMEYVEGSDLARIVRIVPPVVGLADSCLPA
jgi:serine/threonine protein kinase